MSEAPPEVKTYSEMFIPVYETVTERQKYFSRNREFVEFFRENFSGDSESTMIYDLDFNVCVIDGIPSQPSGVMELIKFQMRNETLLNKVNNFSHKENFIQYFESVSDIIARISTLKFDAAAIEISDSDSLIFKLKFSQSTLLVINIALENLESRDPLAVFALLEKDETIVQNYNTIDNIIEGMQLYLVD